VQAAMLTAESFVSLTISPGNYYFPQTVRNKTRASFIEMCRLSQFVIFYRPLKFLISTLGRQKPFYFRLKKKQPASDPASNLAGGGN